MSSPAPENGIAVDIDLPGKRARLRVVVGPVMVLLGLHPDEAQALAAQLDAVARQLAAGSLVVASEVPAGAGPLPSRR